MDAFEPTFRFKEFGITDRRCGLRTGTDGVLLGAWATCPHDGNDCAILDVGAGCGLISFMLAMRYPGAMVRGVEIDHGAMEDFRENLQHFPRAGAVEAVEADFCEEQGYYDLIVSNPPFFTNGALSPLQARAGARHAGTLSPLVLPEFAARHLRPGGRLAMITPVELEGDVNLHTSLAHMKVIRCVRVATSARRGVTRLLWELTLADDPTVPMQEQMLSVGDDAYRALTSRFYLHY